MNPDKMTETPAANDEPITIVWEGVPVVLPPGADDWDLDVVEAFEQGRVVTAIRGVLGSKAYDAVRVAFKATNGRAPKARDLEPLMDEIAKAYGMETAGN